MSNNPFQYKYYLTFDVEAIGLHGEAYAYGYIVHDQDRRVLEVGRHACPMELATGLAADRDWCEANIAALDITVPTPWMLREAFWKTWLEWRVKGAVLAADCSWPVEANFLTACVRDASNGERNWEGPYPMLDISTLAYAVGLNPTLSHSRNKDELPHHDPLADARQSARLMFEYLDKINKR